MIEIPYIITRKRGILRQLGFFGRPYHRPSRPTSLTFLGHKPWQPDNGRDVFVYVAPKPSPVIITRKGVFRAYNPHRHLYLQPSSSLFALSVSSGRRRYHYS